MTKRPGTNQYRAFSLSLLFCSSTGKRGQKRGPFPFFFFPLQNYVGRVSGLLFPPPAWMNNHSPPPFFPAVNPRQAEERRSLRVLFSFFPRASQAGKDIKTAPPESYSPPAQCIQRPFFLLPNGDLWTAREGRQFFSRRVEDLSFFFFSPPPRPLKQAAGLFFFFFFPLSEAQYPPLLWIRVGPDRGGGWPFFSVF